MTTLKIGIVGFGKIARDQHLPAITATNGLELVAVADPNTGSDMVPAYPTLEAMISVHPEIGAVSLCQPPSARFAAAIVALAAGKHVFLEKPPGVSVAQVNAMSTSAQARGVTLFTGWHSRFGSAIAPARLWLRSKSPRRIAIIWREDVRQWHPGQAWIWEEGGFGVFDPGINALSILTALFDAPIRLCDATLEIPANRAMPIAARLEMESADGCAIIADFDWRQAGLQSWVIEIETDTGNARLSHGGNRLEIDGRQQQLEPAREYAAMYAHFADLIGSGRSDIDTAPLALAELALATGRRIVTESFRD